MERYSAILDSLKNRIEKLISMYETACSENLLLQQKLDKCNQKLEESNNRIKDLEKQIANLQLIEAFKVSSQDNKEAKQKVGKLIKEIDKCIGMLND